MATPSAAAVEPAPLLLRPKAFQDFELGKIYGVGFIQSSGFEESYYASTFSPIVFIVIRYGREPAIISQQKRRDLWIFPEHPLQSLGIASGCTSKKEVYRSHLCIKDYGQKFITKERKTAYVKLERVVFDQLDHPGIIKLFFTFQDTFSLCRLTEDEARFTAEVVDALEYIHGLGLIHRDIKIFPWLHYPSFQCLSSGP